MFGLGDYEMGEVTAAILVAGHTGCVEIVAHDTGAEEGAHDFDLLLPVGRVVALEVTTAANKVEISQWAAISKRDWDMTKLRNSWSLALPQVGVGSPGDVGKLRKKCEPFLVILEENGVDQIEGVNHTLPAPAQEAIAALRALGVVHGARFRDTGETTVIITSSGTYSGSADAVNRAVEPLAVENAPKLRRAEADERHLFVWVDSTIHAATLTLHSNFPPTTHRRCLTASTRSGQPEVPPRRSGR